MRRRRLSLPILEKKSGELQEPVKFWVLREYNPISFVGLPSVPRDLGPKPTSCLGRWVKSPRRRNFTDSKKRRATNELDLLLAVSLLVVFRTFVDVLLTILQHPINQSGKPVGHRRNGFGGAELGAQAAVLGSKVALAAEQCGRCHAQGRRSTVDHTPRASAQDAVATDPVVRAKSQPRGKVGLGFPPAHVQSYFAQNGLGDHYFNSVDAR